MQAMQEIYKWKNSKGQYRGFWIAKPHHGFHKPGIYTNITGKQIRFIPLWGKGW